MNEGLAVFIVFLASFLGAFGSLYLKKGSKAFSFNILEQLQNYKLILGLFLYGISALMFIFALQFGDLSMLYPVTSLTYVWVSFLSVKHLNEDMNKFKWFGIVLIIVGVTLVTR